MYGPSTKVAAIPCSKLTLLVYMMSLTTLLYLVSMPYAHCVIVSDRATCTYTHWNRSNLDTIEQE